MTTQQEIEMVLRNAAPAFAWSVDSEPGTDWFLCRGQAGIPERVVFFTVSAAGFEMPGFASYASQKIAAVDWRFAQAEKGIK